MKRLFAIGHVVVVAALIGINDVGVCAQKPTPVPVFITSAGAANGFHGNPGLDRDTL